MSTTHSSAANALKIDRPTCARCGSSMWLLKISQDGVGTEFRKFECPVCEVSTGDEAVDTKKA